LIPLEFIEYEAPYLDRLVRLWRQAFEFGVGVTDQHSLAEQREYFVSEVLPTNQVTLALLESKLGGFVASSAESVAQLHVQVGLHRQGIGSALLALSKARSAGSLWLYAFTRNTGRASSTRSTPSFPSSAASNRTGSLKTSSTAGRRRQAAWSELSAADLLTLAGRTIWATMSRRRTIIAFIALCGTRGAAEAQQTVRIARIGFLSTDIARSPMFAEAFRQGMRDLGYVEGRNVLIEVRDAHGNPDRFPTLAGELVSLKVDVILAPGTQQALAAMQATTTIPIVFADVADPEARGLVATLARPGGNVTGLTNLNTDLIAKWLELLKQAVPRMATVAFLWDPGYLPERAQRNSLSQAQVAAQALGVRLQFVEARQPEEFDRAFSDMIKARADALIVWGNVTFIRERTRLVELAARSRLPATYPFREFVDAGGLMSYAPSVVDNFRRAAGYVDKILKGAKPADLPVEQSSRFELVINLKTASALGLRIPPSLLQRADRVIE